MNQIKAMLLILCILPIFSHAQTNTQQPSGVSELSQELRTLFSQEMVALKKGLQQITASYIAGDWSTIESTALKMEQSYILRQNLTNQQMHQLHSLLSPAFIKLDGEFHYLAGMLNHAAKMEKVEMIGFYLSKMSETCVSCHSQYAAHKFPLFKTTVSNNSHH
jgi:hypothetical protein